MLETNIEMNGDVFLVDSGSFDVCKNGSFIDQKDLLEPLISSVPLNATETLEEKHILTSYADVCSKIKDHQIFNTVHFVAAYSKVMEKNKEELMKKNHKVYFEDKELSYTGVPFIVSSHRTLDCHQGKDRNVKLKAEYRTKQNEKAAADHSFQKPKTILQVTKKLDCPAKVYIKEVCEFPEFKLERDSDRLRKDASKNLRLALTEDRNIVMCRKYILRISDVLVHKNHPVGDAAGFTQPVSDELIVKIGELVGVGVNTVSEMKQHLETFVSIDFSSSKMPLTSNKHFFPRNEIIRNHMMKARCKLRHSLIDQDCLLKKITEWEDNFKESCIKFRQKGESSMDNDLVLQNSLLFVYQNKWQRRLLLRYGNELALLDDTYRTTRYALPLFFLVVKTNIDYQIVATFVCENEMTEAITEALVFIKKLNPSFQPKFFMTDYSNEEINALESVFPECSVFICDFHREQAWERWLSKSINGCSTIKNDVKIMLRWIAHAKTIPNCKEAVKALKDSYEYKNYPKLIDYLKNTWFCIKKRWVFAYRQDRLLLNVNTNNGIEWQNQCFKYSFLERRKTSSLTAMLSVCIEEFLPHKYDSYVDENRRANSSYRKYHENIPNYLTNRPRPLVNHCMRMIDKLHGVDLSGVTALTYQLYSVPSFQFNSRLKYQCYLGDAEHLPTCSCPSWFRSAYLCKHFFAIFKKQNLSWFALGAAY